MYLSTAIQQGTSTTGANDVDQTVLTESKQQHQTQQRPYSGVLNISVNKCDKKIIKNHHDDLTQCDRRKMG